MTKILRKYYIIAIIIISPLLTQAQDAQLSQFYAAPLYLGPSFAGMTNGSRISINFRKQWPVIANGFNTYAVAFDNYFPTIKSGGGVIVLRDDMGTGNLRLTSIGTVYSYLIDVNKKWHIKPGLTFWYARHDLDFYRLMFPDQVENGNPTIETPTQKYKAHIDFSSSAIVYNKSMWLGLTMDHMLRPNQSLSGAKDRIPYKWSVYGGTKVPIRTLHRSIRSKDESITAAFLYKQQGDWNQFDMGLYWNKAPLNLGIWWRGIPVGVKNPGMDALIFLAGLDLYEYTFSYSYDVTISELGVNSGGTHEISFSYTFNINKKMKKKRGAVPCPKF